MKKSEFIKKLKEVLEIEDKEITEETNLQNLEEFDSLGVMSVIALVDESFGKKLSFSSGKFRSITTVNSLIKIIGEENFE